MSEIFLFFLICEGQFRRLDLLLENKATLEKCDYVIIQLAYAGFVLLHQIDTIPYAVV